MSTIKILAVSGSLRSNSSNIAIIHKMAAMVPGQVQINIYEGLAYLPHFNPELDTETPPVQVAEWRKLLNEADGVLICTPEYAFGVPGSLKNALDWTVSSGEFVNKPVALVTASSVGESAHASLLLTLGAISARVADDAQLLIPFVRSKVSNEGHITDAGVLASLDIVLKSLINNIQNAV